MPAQPAIPAVQIAWLSPATARHKRTDQRRAAEILGRGMDGLVSRTHSRGLVAVACASAGRLGLDAEYADPARPWRDIVAMFLPDAASSRLDADAGCRLWTFGEAHLKAFGELPSADLLKRIAALPAEIDAASFAPRRWLHVRRLDGFWLTLVWEPA